MRKPDNNYTERVKAILDDIYENTHDDYMTDGFARYRKNALFVHCSRVLCGMGIINNLGSRTSPIYTWKSSDKPKDVLEDVISGVRAINTEYRNNKKNKRAKIKVKETKTAVTLVNFSDQQLWDELKGRGYSIMNEKLCRLNYLN